MRVCKLSRWLLKLVLPPPLSTVAALGITKPLSLILTNESQVSLKTLTLDYVMVERRLDCFPSRRHASQVRGSSR